MTSAEVKYVADLFICLFIYFHPSVVSHDNIIISYDNIRCIQNKFLLSVSSSSNMTHW